MDPHDLPSDARRLLPEEIQASAAIANEN